ncbi:hypothetical protein D6D01_00198 [Aureobasidium pullulans]|uniref:BZIP domain-containing protein n=1 Tax=Aureobasidium pullulans TaxID=5580 RepID=A0A4S9M2M6_AURPU|nr:hypothetical protein D6D01_00198 [Aureobasidium pullulans]
MSTESRIDSAQPEKTARRKRSREESEPNNDENKKRGRPRLDTQDESAADRRRTQIRVAQRAYRQRKENTIDELRKQVEELQGTIQSMNQSFSHFSAKCSATNVPSSLLADLQNIAQLYASGQSHADSLSSSESPEMVSHPFGQGIDSNIKDHSKSFLADSANISPRTEVRQTTWSPLAASDSTTDSFDPMENNQVSMSMMRSLGIPESYSSFESTFARRLHRASCEYAYRLACDPTRIPVLFNNVFKLTLKAAGTVDRVKYSLQSTLSRSTREPLSNWGVTFIHVGGAGTHYPRPPEEGGLGYQSPNSWAVTTVGPHKIGGSTIEEALTAEMLLRGVTGMDGEWFDAYDVEGYLAEKGIRLDPSSSFAEIELPGDGSSSPESSAGSPPMDPMTAYVQHLTTSDPGTSPNPAAFYPGLSNLEYLPAVSAVPQHRKSYPEVQGNYEPHIDERRSTAPMIGQQYGLGMPIPGGMYPYAYQPVKKTTVTIDVGKFVQQMSLAGTCLMRAPGYRRKDIDIALRRSLVHAH